MVRTTWWNTWLADTGTNDERNYRPITFLNTCNKIFKGMISNYMKEHAGRTADQLIIDNAIMDEVRNQQRSLAVALYDFQKVCDMVRCDYMAWVYQSMGLTERIVNIIVKLLEGWETRLE